MKFYIETFGCKVNTYESNFMKESLLSDGFIFTQEIKDADIIIINTCTVTNNADSKCRKFVRRVRRENPKSVLAVVGCSVQNNFEDYNNMNIDILLGNRYKSRIKELINNYLENHEKYIFKSDTRDLNFEDMEIDDFDHTRAFIKIQDGCDNFCTYCIIPFMRGKCRSKNFNMILDEAKKLVNNGHKEIVLTGIHTGTYQYENHDLVDVINEISKLDGLERIRLSSVEITELNDKFLNMLKNNSKFCHHLHVPLQAGSNEILKLMNRKYDLDYYANKINTIRNIIPDIAISTDIIVGFPTETDDMFKSTYDFAASMEFSKIHVFPYSKRDGTVASRMKEVSDNVKTKRVHQLLELSSILEMKYNKKFNNKIVKVLIEEIKGNKSIGHTSNYLKVEINKILDKNKIYEVEYKI